MNDNDMLEYMNQNGTWTQIQYKDIVSNGWRIQGEVLFYKDSYGQWSGTKYRVISTSEEEETAGASTTEEKEENNACSSEEADYAEAMHDFQEANSEYQAAVQSGTMVNGKTSAQWAAEKSALQLEIDNTNSDIRSLDGTSVADRGRQHYIGAIDGIENKFFNLPVEKNLLGWVKWQPLVSALYLYKIRDSACESLRAGGSGNFSPPGGQEANTLKTKNMANMSSYPKLYNSGWGAEDLNSNVSTYSYATRVLPDMDLNYIRLNALLYGKGCLSASGTFTPFEKDKGGYYYELKIVEQNYAKARDLEKTSTSKIAAAKKRLASAYQAALSAYNVLKSCYVSNDRMPEFAGVVKPELPA